MIFIFSDIITKIQNLNPRVIAVDGPAASGKSTLSELLARRFDCAVFHMDDFFLPPARKTHERLSEPGGNVDYERFKSEVTDRLSEGGTVKYNKYDCRSGVLIPTEAVLTYPVVVEGSYSLHPALRDVYDLKIFLDVSADEQARRVLKRGGEELARRFQNEWIPLENAYFDRLKIREICDIIVDTTNFF